MPIDAATSKQYAHAFKVISCFSNHALSKILKHFESLRDAWYADEDELLLCNVHKASIGRFIATRDSIHIEHEWEKLNDLGIHIIEQTDDMYPTLLKSCAQSPTSLYIHGNIHTLNHPLISIVGSRNCTPYGTRVCTDIVKDLVYQGYGIVSGLAYGIDSTAHKTCVEASGITVAVLGSGLHPNKIATSSRLTLLKKILATNGAIISEYAPLTSACKYTFPERNRIIAGLSLGTIIVEASLRSGSLISARFAKKYSRPVFAVPGSIYSEGSEGPHSLICQGAHILSRSEVVREVLTKTSPLENIRKTVKKQQNEVQIPLLSDDEITVLEILSREPLHIDKILNIITLDTSQTQAALLLLELKGLIESLSTMEYRKLYT